MNSMLQCPEVLKPFHCERRNTGSYPVRYIKQKIDPDDLKTITLTLPNGQNEKIIVYLDETGEQYLKMLMQHREVSLPDKTKHVSLTTEMVKIGQGLQKLNSTIENLKKELR